MRNSSASLDNSDLQLVWRDLIPYVDQKLRDSIDRLNEDCPDRLRQAIAYSLLAPGKRLRPILCLLTCRAISGDFERGIANAAALEMIHCYSLIHDDLPAMDDDDVRRGRPTLHVQFDEATAILAGDALQPMAFECICTSELPFEAVRKSCLILAQAAGAQGMVGGQMDDLLAEDRDPSQYDHAANARFLQAIHSRKTGAMIRASVELGGIAGGADPAQSDCLARFSHAIGIAFQIVDDLLDVESTLENTGKRTGKDQERGKLTFPGVYGIPASRERAHGLVAEAVAAVEPLGETARPLQQIARYILERSN